MQQLTRPAPENEQITETCRHHWIIDAPTGPVSQGACRLCGKTREFKNYIDAAPWGDDKSSKNSDVQLSIVSTSDDLEESGE